MSLIDAAQAAIPLIEHGGVISVLVLCVAGLVGAVVVLWRVWAVERRKRQEERDMHHEWALKQVARQSESQRRIGDMLASIDAGIKGIEGFMRGAIGGRS